MEHEPLEKLRIQIDILDEELLNILARRVETVAEIGSYKKANNLPPLDEERWQIVLQSKLEKGRVLNLSPEFVQQFYDLIHEYSLDIEHKVLEI